MVFYLSIKVEIAVKVELARICIFVFFLVFGIIVGRQTKNVKILLTFRIVQRVRGLDGYLLGSKTYKSKDDYPT